MGKPRGFARFGGSQGGALQDLPLSTHRVALQWQSTPADLTDLTEIKCKSLVFWPLGIFLKANWVVRGDCVGFFHRLQLFWAMKAKPVGALWLAWLDKLFYFISKPRKTPRPKLKSVVTFSNFKSNWKRIPKGFFKRQYSNRLLHTKVCPAEFSNVPILLPTTVGYLRQDWPMIRFRRLLKKSPETQNFDAQRAPRGICSSRRCVRYHRTLNLNKRENMEAASMMPGPVPSKTCWWSGFIGHDIVDSFMSASCQLA